MADGLRASGSSKADLVLQVAGRDVTITHPDKVIFPDSGITKGNLVHYYLDVAEGALRGYATGP